METVSLTVCCDNSATCHVTVSVGTGWARVAVHAPPAVIGERLAFDIPRAAAMLVAAGMAAWPAAVTFTVSGPDAPPDPAALRHEASRVWGGLEASRLWGASPEPRSGPPSPASAARPALAPIPADVARPALAPISADVAPISAGVARPAISEPLVSHMVSTVAAYVRQYGAAPDFATTRPSVRERVYNYIRSTTANPQASNEVVEEVRLRIAAQ